MKAIASRAALATCLCLVVALAAVGCSGSSGGGGEADTGGGQDVSGHMDVPFVPDVPAGRPDGEGKPEIVGPGPDVALDTGRADVGIRICPGDPGCACESNDDCLTRLCVETTEGRVCSEFCITSGDCPDDWICVRDITPGGVDEATYCRPRHPRLCMPCERNAECGTSGQCVEIVPGMGAFCGGNCTAASDCPQGYECRTVESVAGNPAQQCLPVTDECDCTAHYARQGYSTECSVSNEHGTCLGLRVCEIGGLSDCDADVPMAEICNGLDDNCNNAVDELVGQQACEICNDFGCCTGTSFCVGGEERCNANIPSLDVCDGIDNDCDGVTDWPHVETHCEDERVSADDPTFASDGIYDCIDLDDDNDGWLDEDDNCVCGYNPDQADLDGDGRGDVCDPDIDGDGTPNEYDCEPRNAAVRPGATEVCNGIDDNCDGRTDEGWPDCDGDGIADCMDPDDDGDGVPDGLDNCICGYNPDQADNDGDRRGDVCDPDDDNDGIPDDGDGSGVIGDNPCPDGVRMNCDDNCQFIFNPDQADNDGDGLGDACDPDDDNDGIPDLQDNCQFVHNPDQADLDRDGVGDACDPDIDGDGIVNAADCDPYDRNVYPGAPELCNGRDDDCDGQTDEPGATGCQLYCRDRDGDGYGGNEIQCLCEPTGEFTATRCDDCNDFNRNINPGMPEDCATVQDDNCNGTNNEPNGLNCTFFCTDMDGDGYGVLPAVCLCYPQAPLSATQCNDCDDGRRDIHPDQAEDCATPYDDNCTGSNNDLNALGCTRWYWDQDGDGYGTDAYECRCSPNVDVQGGVFYRAPEPGDCRDDVRAVNPGQLEICGNAYDDNCDGEMDEAGCVGCVNYYFDGDQDGYGLASDFRCLPSAQPPYSANFAGDCNDDVAEVNPGAPEVCDGFDNNCNLLVDAEEVPFGLCPDPCGLGDSFVCQGGRCVLQSCRPGAARIPITAQCCECELDGNEPVGNLPSTAIDLGEFRDTGAAPVTISGNIASSDPTNPNGDVDWYRFYAVDLADSSCDRFKVQVQFTQNPNNDFEMAIFRGGAAGSNEICTGVSDLFTWSTYFHVEAPYTVGAVSGSGFVGGECGCRPWTAGEYSPTDSTHHICTDNSAVFYVKVTRKASSQPSCVPYQLQISNGFYAGP